MTDTIINRWVTWFALDGVGPWVPEQQGTVRAQGFRNSDRESLPDAEIARNEKPLASRGVSSGMVQVGSRTFRIERVASQVYQVVRLLDDALIGRFRMRSGLEICPTRASDALLLREVARTAVRQGKTLWRRSG